MFGVNPVCMARAFTFQLLDTTLIGDLRARVTLWKAAQGPSHCPCYQEALQAELFRSENHSQVMHW